MLQGEWLKIIAMDNVLLRGKHLILSLGQSIISLLMYGSSFKIIFLAAKIILRNSHYQSSSVQK